MLCYNEEWRLKFSDADAVDMRRRRIRVVGGNDANGNTKDEGYQSGLNSDNEDEYGL
jgi:hypothetical protein